MIPLVALSSAAHAKKPTSVGGSPPAGPVEPVAPTQMDKVFPQVVHLQYVRKLVLDPGHGGDNLGTLGVLGIREKALTLEISKRAAAYIRAHSDVEVALTRDADLPLALRDRPRIANELKGDALISVHANFHEAGEAQGMEVFFLAAESSVEATKQLIEREEGIRADDATAALPWSVGAIVSDLNVQAAHRRSEAFASGLATGLKKTRPKARFRGVRQAPFGVLKEAKMPALVFEVGYLSHPVEARTLLEPAVQVQFAQAMLLAIIKLDKQLAAEQAHGKLKHK